MNNFEFVREHMKAILILIYLVIYSLVTIFGFIVSFENISISLVINTVLSVLCVIGSALYLMKEKLFSPGFWLITFYSVLVSTGLGVFSAFLEGMILFVPVVLLFQIPVLILVKRYSNPNAIYWFSVEQVKRASKMSDYLAHYPLLELESESHKVKISIAAGGFNSEISRRADSHEEVFSEVLPNIAALLRYVETYTHFRLDDFTKKYA